MKTDQIPTRIHASAPVRICDIGGWTDTWFAGNGAVFNIAVSPGVDVEITVGRPKSGGCITLHLLNYNETYCPDPSGIPYGKHPLIEAGIDIMEIPPDISLEIKISSKIPAGASVGTSAAVTVALIGALDALTPGRLSAHQIAALAHRVETEKLGLQSGIQDQLCSAYGGINFIHMHRFPDAAVTTLNVPPSVSEDLQKRLVLVYIGTPHNSSAVHQKVIKDLGETAAQDYRLETLRQLATAARDALSAGDLPALGGIMNRNTDIQRQLHPSLVCSKFEELIQIAGSYQALGCKVNGAGGNGGSVTILTNGNQTKKQALLNTLTQKGFHSIPTKLSPTGLTIGVPPY